MEGASLCGRRQLGVYAGRPEVPWTEDLALPTVPSPHLIVGFKKAAEPIVLNALLGTDIQPVLLRIGSIWGPLFDPFSPFEASSPTSARYYADSVPRHSTPMAAEIAATRRTPGERSRCS